MSDTNDPTYLHPRRIQHEIRARLLTVLNKENVTPDMIRVTFTSETLSDFSSPGFDDHIKLILPDVATGIVRIPEIGPNGIIWPEGEKPIMRDYTPLDWDNESNSLTIDFTNHHNGPATKWAEKAKVGDQVGIAGPRGSFIVPTEYDWHLFIGDDAAIPSISRRLKELPSNSMAIAIIETEGPQDEIEFESNAPLKVEWLHRAGRKAGVADTLLETVRSIELPDGPGYIWIASETSVAKTLRNYFTKEIGFPARRIRASGYWKHGAAGIHERIED